VDPQEPDNTDVQSVEETPVQRGRLAAFTDTLMSYVGPRDHHISDDEIFVMLLGGDDAEATAELRRAKGVTFPTYCVWKQKYGRLFFDDFVKLRRKERQRHYAIVGAVAVAAVLAIGVPIVGVVLSTVAKTEQQPAASVLPSGTRRPPLVGYQAAVGSNLAIVASQSPTAVSEPVPSTEPQTAADVPQATPSVDVPGYKIQVTAAPNMREGRAVVEQLTSAGYPAYISTAIVENREVIRVRVGPFETLAAAQEKASQLQTAGYKGAWISR
jgi:cell division septation protein DedD